MKKIIWIIILFTICALSFFGYYYNVFTRTSAVVQLIQKQDNQIKVKFEDGSEKLIKTQQIIIPLLNENQQYFVVFYQNKLRPPFLIKIEPDSKY